MEKWEESGVEGDITGMMVEAQKIEVGKMFVTEEEIDH